MPPAATPGRPRLVTVAFVLAALGILAIVAAFVDKALGSDDPPLAFYLLALLLPLGMVVAAVAVARDYRRPRT